MKKDSLLTKDTLIKGTLILAAAALVARVLGLVQRVPLQYYLDDYGMALYGISYNIYFALLIIATAGIPSALSKLVADRLALGREREAQLIYRAAVRFAIAAGVIMTVLLYVLAPIYATHIAHVPESALAIRALAPALLLFPLIAIMRGYFQGRQVMKAGGISQIVEQILRVLTAVLIVALFIGWGYSLEMAAAGASFGGVMGSIGAFAIMLYFWLRLRRANENSESVEPEDNSLPRTREIYKQIFRLSVPISIISIIVPAMYFIDSSIVVPFIQGQLAGGAREAQEILGILVGRAQSFAGIPPILAIALSTSIIPIISAAYAKKDNQQLSKQSSMAIRLSLLAGLPVVVMLIVAARSYNVFLFGDDKGTWIIIAMTGSAMLQIVMMTSGAILMGLGLTRAPMGFVAIGVVVKLVASFIFAAWWGIYGIIGATSLAFLLILLLNIITLRRHVKISILGFRWFGLILGVALMLSAGVAFEQWAHGLGWREWFIALSSTTLLALIYPFLLAFGGVLRKGDVELLPAKLQRLIQKTKFHRILRGS